MKFCSICSAVALTIVLFTGAHAAVIPKDSNIKLNTYTEFNWAPTTVKKVQDFAVDLIAPARVHITDLDPYGEGFSIYDNNVFVGETSTVKTKNKPHSVKDHHYRQGFFNLEQGHHVITVKLKGNSGVGNGAIRIVPVNEEKKLALGQNMIFRAILGNQLNVKKEAAVRASSNQIRYEAKNDDDDDDDDTDDDDDDEEHDD